ncbi:MAG: hypothetical protein V1770_03480 [bacterium]
MLSNFIKGKVYIFIDSANVFYSQRTLNWRISYSRFMKYLKKECGENLKCFIYLAYDENKEKERKFLDLRKLKDIISQ